MPGADSNSKPALQLRLWWHTPLTLCGTHRLGARDSVHGTSLIQACRQAVQCGLRSFASSRRVCLLARATGWADAVAFFSAPCWGGAGMAPSACARALPAMLRAQVRGRRLRCTLPPCNRARKAAPAASQHIVRCPRPLPVHEKTAAHPVVDACSLQASGAPARRAPRDWCACALTARGGKVTSFPHPCTRKGYGCQEAAYARQQP